MTEKRFKETISTGIVTDTITGKEYNCEYRINDELLELINKIVEENKELKEENEQLKQVLGSILIEVKRDITNTSQTGEVKVFINPNSFDLISDVLRRYGALKEWYDD